MFKHSTQGYIAPFQKKINNFFEHKIFFFVHHHHQLFLSTWNTFSCNIKLFVSTQNCFSCNTKLLFWTLLRIFCHGHTYFCCHVGTKIEHVSKKIKFHFCMTQKNNFVFCASQFFYIQFLHFTLAACWSSLQES